MESDSDHAYAAQLQQEEHGAAMMASASGKAVLLVTEIIALAQSTNRAFPELNRYKIEAVSYDDMVYFAERMLHLHQEFTEGSIPSNVDVGYHYSQESNLPKIKTHGLLTKGDRSTKNVSSDKNHGSTFGDGIYTANNPKAFDYYGDVGLVVGRLQGKTVQIPKQLQRGTNVSSFNTVIGHKLIGVRNLDTVTGMPFDDYHNEVVLRTSKQVLPMIRYDKDLLIALRGKECVAGMQKCLEKILVAFFNDSHHHFDSGMLPPSFSTMNPTSKVSPSTNQPSASLAKGGNLSASANAPSSLKCSGAFSQQLATKHTSLLLESKEMVEGKAQNTFSNQKMPLKQPAFSTSAPSSGTAPPAAAWSNSAAGAALKSAQDAPGAKYNQSTEKKNAPEKKSSSSGELLPLPGFEEVDVLQRAIERQALLHNRIVAMEAAKAGLEMAVQSPGPYFPGAHSASAAASAPASAKSPFETTPGSIFGAGVGPSSSKPLGSTPSAAGDETSKTPFGIAPPSNAMAPFGSSLETTASARPYFNSTSKGVFGSGLTCAPEPSPFTDTTRKCNFGQSQFGKASSAVEAKPPPPTTGSNRNSTPRNGTGGNDTSSTTADNERGGDSTDSGERRLSLLPLSEDSNYSKYFKMMKANVPRSWVIRVVEVDGKDARILNLDPNLPLSDQVGGAVDDEGNVDWDAVTIKRKLGVSALHPTSTVGTFPAPAAPVALSSGGFNGSSGTFVTSSGEAASALSAGGGGFGPLPLASSSLAGGGIGGFGSSAAPSFGSQPSTFGAPSTVGTSVSQPGAAAGGTFGGSSAETCLGSGSLSEACGWPCCCCYSTASKMDDVKGGSPTASGREPPESAAAKEASERECKETGEERDNGNAKKPSSSDSKAVTPAQEQNVERKTTTRTLAPTATLLKMALPYCTVSPQFIMSMTIHVWASTVVHRTNGTHAMNSVSGAISVHCALQLALNILNRPLVAKYEPGNNCLSRKLPVPALRRTLSDSQLCMALLAEGDLVSTSVGNATTVEGNRSEKGSRSAKGTLDSFAKLKNYPPNVSTKNAANEPFYQTDHFIMSTIVHTSVSTAVLVMSGSYAMPNSIFGAIIGHCALHLALIALYQPWVSMSRSDESQKKVHLNAAHAVPVLRRTLSDSQLLGTTSRTLSNQLPSSVARLDRTRAGAQFTIPSFKATSATPTSTLETATYAATKVQDGPCNILLQSITAMPEYQEKSFEELRLQEYLARSVAPPSSFSVPQPCPEFFHSITALLPYNDTSFEELRLRDYSVGNRGTKATITYSVPSITGGSVPASHQVAAPPESGFSFGGPSPSSLHGRFPFGSKPSTSQDGNQGCSLDCSCLGCAGHSTVGFSFGPSPGQNEHAISMDGFSFGSKPAEKKRGEHLSFEAPKAKSVKMAPLARNGTTASASAAKLNPTSSSTMADSSANKAGLSKPYGKDSSRSTGSGCGRFRFVSTEVDGKNKSSSENSSNNTAIGLQEEDGFTFGTKSVGEKSFVNLASEKSDESKPHGEPGPPAISFTKDEDGKTSSVSFFTSLSPLIKEDGETIKKVSSVEPATLSSDLMGGAPFPLMPAVAPKPLGPPKEVALPVLSDTLKKPALNKPYLVAAYPPMSKVPPAPFACTQLAVGAVMTSTSIGSGVRAEGLSSMFKVPEEGSWKCGVCMVTNKPSVTACADCDSPKPGEEDETTTNSSAVKPAATSRIIEARGLAIGGGLSSSLGKGAKNSAGNGSSGFSFRGFEGASTEKKEGLKTTEKKTGGTSNNVFIASSTHVIPQTTSGFAFPLKSKLGSSMAAAPSRVAAFSKKENDKAASSNGGTSSSNGFSFAGFSGVPAEEKKDDSGTAKSVPSGGFGPRSRKRPTTGFSFGSAAIEKKDGGVIFGAPKSTEAPAATSIGANGFLFTVSGVKPGERKLGGNAAGGPSFHPTSEAAPDNPFSGLTSCLSTFPPAPAAKPSPFSLPKKEEAKSVAAAAPSSAAYPPMSSTATNPCPTKPSSFDEKAMLRRSPRIAKRLFAPQTITYVAPLALTSGVPSDALTSPPLFCDMNEDCVICHEALSAGTCTALAKCSHVYHSKCIELAFKAKPQCPICRVAVGAAQGKSPSGEMRVELTSTSCSGFLVDSIEIGYDIPSAIQMSYHENPGAMASGKYVTAYLPNNDEGRALLKRLAYAFMHGLTFMVGTSVTTGRNNQCTWASIHHKTSTSGGVRKHGFPDADYFDNCNEELDTLNIPPAIDLNYDGTDA